MYYFVREIDQLRHVITVIDLAHASAAWPVRLVRLTSEQWTLEIRHVTQFTVAPRILWKFLELSACLTQHTVQQDSTQQSAHESHHCIPFQVISYIRHEHSFAPIHSSVTFRLISGVAFCDKCLIVRPLSVFAPQPLTFQLSSLLLLSPNLENYFLSRERFRNFRGYYDVDCNSPRLLWTSPRAPCLSLVPERSTTRLVLALQLPTPTNLPRPWFGVEFSISWLHGTSMNTFVADSLLFVRELSKLIS